ncbi:MAG TPA: hypothetical protein VEU33_39975 [Archangium sp.]|nr:hypothetical protein [Archangium sp.]
MRIRRLTLDDLPACLALAVKRDWPPDELKWRMILELGTGFGVDSPDGGLAGTVLVTPHGREAASIAMMVVSQALHRLAYRALVAERDGRVVGHGLAWPTFESTMVGPLIAWEEPIARSLAAGLLRGLEGTVRVDIPPRFTGLSEWVAGLGLERHAPAPMMQLHGTRAPGRRAQLHAIAAQALG